MNIEIKNNKKIGDITNVEVANGNVNIGESKGQSNIKVENGTVNVNKKYYDTNSVDIGPNAKNRKELKRFDDKDQKNIAIISLIITGVSALPAIIDLLGIIDLPLWLIILFLVLILGVMWDWYDKDLKYNLKVFLNKNVIGKTPFHLYDDKFVVLKKGKYIISVPDVKCIYPNCNGRIIIGEQPERKPQFNKKLFGNCSKYGKEHSYAIGSNFIAYKRDDINWTPKPKTDLEKLFD